ncbi:MAG: hypothetical protein ACREBW_03130 [Candidatus Micrarchaeaceae archaeon]
MPKLKTKTWTLILVVAEEASLFVEEMEWKTMYNYDGKKVTYAREILAARAQVPPYQVFVFRWLMEQSREYRQYPNPWHKTFCAMMGNI